MTINDTSDMSAHYIVLGSEEFLSLSILNAFGLSECHNLAGSVVNCAV